jgi:hypothetical protein
LFEKFLTTPYRQKVFEEMSNRGGRLRPLHDLTRPAIQKIQKTRTT